MPWAQGPKIVNQTTILPSSVQPDDDEEGGNENWDEIARQSLQNKNQTHSTDKAISGQRSIQPPDNSTTEIEVEEILYKDQGNHIIVTRDGGLTVMAIIGIMAFVGGAGVAHHIQNNKIATLDEEVRKQKEVVHNNLVKGEMTSKYIEELDKFSGSQGKVNKQVVEQLKELAIKSDFSSQALVSGMVYSALTTARDLQQSSIA